MRNLTIVFLIVLSGIYLLIGTFTENVDFSTLKMMGTFGLVQLTLSIYSYVYKNQTLVSPYVVFLFCLYIFSFGQSLLYPFDLVGSRDLDGFRGITTAQVFRGQIITLIFLGFFHIGALLRSKHLKLCEYTLSRALYENRRLKQIAWFVVIVSAYPYYNELISNAIMSLSYGYGSIYHQTSRIGLDNAFGILADCFIPGVIALYVAYRNMRIWRIILSVVLILNCLTLLVTGGRSEAVIILALILILHNYLVKQFSKKALLLIVAFGMVLLLVLATVGKMRSGQNRSIQEMAQSEKIDNAAVESISEMGWSMFCLIKTDEILSEEDEYRYGSSYLISFLSVIPNLGFWDIHPAKQANMSDWLSDRLNMGYGTGFSMCAEAYINFGYFGALMMLVFGYFFNSFFGNLKNAISSRHIAFTALTFIIFWFSLKLPRNSFIGIVRAFFYYGLPIYWYSRGYIMRLKN